MANIKIIITNQAGAETDVSYNQEIAIALSFLISDVSNPDKRNASYSKTIVLPGTKEVDIVFSHIWKLNNALTGFDPRLKCGIKYFINDKIQFDGDLRIVNVVVNPDSKEKSYEILATGILGNLFIAIGNKLITGNTTPADDIDMSAYDHALTAANVLAVPTYGVGYAYGLMNLGLNQINSETEFHVKDFRPAIFKRDLMAKIFTDAGYTWTSTRLDSAAYKRELVFCSTEQFKISASDRADAEFFASRNSTQTGTAYGSSYSGSGALWNIATPTTDVVLFNEDTTAPYNDPGGVYNTANGEFTVPVTRKYKLVTEINGVGFTVTNSLNVVTSYSFFTGDVLINIMGWNGSAWVVVATNLQSLLTTAVITCIHQGIFTAGVKYRVEVKPVNLSLLVYSGAMVPIVNGVTTVTQTFGGVVYNPSFPSTLQTTKYFAVVDDLTIAEGDTVEVNQALPTNLKQRDWLMTEIQAANLYLEIDPTNPLNYIIEPRDDGFYTAATTDTDWTDLLDNKKDYQIAPVNALDCKRYEFTNKPDGDFYNDAYFKEWKEVYGFAYTDNVTDFVTGIKKTELVYASTPIVECAGTGILIPKIYKVDANTLKPFKSLPRNLYYGGIINTGWGTWTLKSTLAADVVYSTYPYIGDSDNPYAPTVSLNWDTPKEVFYNYQQATYTANNLSNRFYSKMINELTDDRSCIVKAWFNLDEVRIKNFSFRKEIYVGHPLNSYFKVQTINNYNVNERESTEVTLLKLAEYPAWSGGVAPNPPDPFNTELGRIVNGNLGTGTGGQNYGNNSLIAGGSGNYIAQDAENIVLTNCTNVIVESDVVNFTGIGLSDMVIDNTYSNTTYPTLGGSGSSLSGTTTLGFGSEEDGAVRTVASALITNANIKSFTVIPTAAGNISLDDFKLNGLTFNIENIVDNVSFDIRGNASNNASEDYTIKYIITY